MLTYFLLFSQRKWKNDAHMAIRDCYNARKIDSSSFRAHYYMSEALSQVILYCNLYDVGQSSLAVTKCCTVPVTDH